MIRKQNEQRSRFITAPFVHDEWSTDKIMFCMVIALLPSVGFGVINYGIHAALLILLSVVTAVSAEAIFDLVTGRELTIFDYSAVVTGLCLALILPPSAPLFFAVIGALVAIIPGKMLFGGIGNNYCNPAGLGKLALLLVFHANMVDFSGGSYGSVTPLTELSMGNSISLPDMLLGKAAGCIGTTNAVTILIGAIFLFVVGIIDIEIPLIYLGTFSVYTLLFGGYGLSLYHLCAQIAGGSLLFTAFFMATDYGTRPTTRRARLVYGALMGLLTGILRSFGATENATLYALLVMNLTARFLDLEMIPRAFGVTRLRKTIRNVTGQSGNALQGSRKDESADFETNSAEGELRAFENELFSKEMLGGSETAGTIGMESVRLHENRSKISQDYQAVGPEDLRTENIDNQTSGMDERETIQDPIGTNENYYPNQMFGGNQGPMIDPRSGLPIDPVTGLLMDPNTGYLLDPGSGLPIDPMTGLLIDPTSGYLIDPASSRLIDPRTLQMTNMVYGQNNSAPVNAAAMPVGAGMMPQQNMGAPAGFAQTPGVVDIPTFQSTDHVEYDGDIPDNMEISYEDYGEDNIEGAPEEEVQRPRRMSPGQMERHLKKRQKELMREAISNGEPEVIMDDTTRLDVEAIVRAEQEILEKGEESQYESLEFIDLDEDLAKESDRT